MVVIMDPHMCHGESIGAKAQAARLELVSVFFFLVGVACIHKGFLFLWFVSWGGADICLGFCYPELTSNRGFFFFFLSH